MTSSGRGGHARDTRQPHFFFKIFETLVFVFSFFFLVLLFFSSNPERLERDRERKNTHTLSLSLSPPPSSDACPLTAPDSLSSEAGGHGPMSVKLGLAILTRPDNPTRTRHGISGFGSTLNGFGS